MPRMIPAKLPSIVERGVTYRRSDPVEVDDEELYHHLIRQGQIRDEGQTLGTIDAGQVLHRLAPGTVVTVVREGGLGDVLMVLAVIRELKRALPELAFRLATSRCYLPLVAGLPFVECEPIIEIRGHRANVIDLRGSAERHEGRETMDRIEIFGKVCGIRVRDFSIPLAPVTEDERRRAAELIGHHPTIALAVRGSTHVRTWPLQSVRSFCKLAALRGWNVAALDARELELPAHPRIRNLTGRISMSEAKAVIAASDFCVSPDSGLQHVAEAVGTNCLALYSTTPPALRIAHYRHVKAIWRDSLPCLPCFDRGCAAAPCMEIAPEVVLAALECWNGLGKATDADSIVALPGSAIPSPRESEIMSAWIECPHCQRMSPRLETLADRIVNRRE